MKPARIVSFEEFNKIRPKLGKIVCTSGGFDPIHPGHISCIFQSKQYGDTLVVIVNGDSFLRAKKGKSFMHLAARCHVVSHLKGVDYVIPFEIENDQTVIVALERIRPHIFTKGGDRIDASTIPEWETCQKHKIKIISRVGFDKRWSSSDFLKEWGEFWKSRSNYSIEDSAGAKKDRLKKGKTKRPPKKR
jgi:cytidyltransferase-like protein